MNQSLVHRQPSSRYVPTTLKGAKDRMQALTLAVALAESDPDSLRIALSAAPRALVSACEGSQAY